MSVLGRGRGSLNPARVPAAPGIGSVAIAGDSAISVGFTAPAANGSPAVTGYEVTSSPGGIVATGASSPITVSGLANGTTYTFTVKAINIFGKGPASAASAAITAVRDTKTVSYPGQGPQASSSGDDALWWNTVNDDWFSPTGLSPSAQVISVPSNGTYRIQAQVSWPSYGYPGVGWPNGWSGTPGPYELWLNILRGGSYIYSQRALAYTTIFGTDPNWQGVDQTLALLAGDGVVIWGNHNATGLGMKQWNASMTITKQ